MLKWRKEKETNSILHFVLFLLLFFCLYQIISKKTTYQSTLVQYCAASHCVTHSLTFLFWNCVFFIFNLILFLSRVHAFFYWWDHLIIRVCVFAKDFRTIEKLLCRNCWGVHKKGKLCWNRYSMFGWKNQWCQKLKKSDLVEMRWSTRMNRNNQNNKKKNCRK